MNGDCPLAVLIMTVYVDEQKKSTLKGNKCHKKLENLEFPWFHNTPEQTQIAADTKKFFSIYTQLANLHSTLKTQLATSKFKKKYERPKNKNPESCCQAL